MEIIDTQLWYPKEAVILNRMIKIYRILPFLTLSILLLTFKVNEASKVAKENVFGDIESAMSIGNADDLAKHIGNSVEMELPNKAEGIFMKKQAVLILNDFFNRYPPKAFNIVHKGNSSSGSKYAVGDYTTTGERVFRVTIYIKKMKDVYQIHELEVEAE
jgi:hypothetical protein